MNVCTVCVHSDQMIIDQALRGGQSPTALARSHSLSRSALRRHAARHVPEPIAPEEPGAPVAIASGNFPEAMTGTGTLDKPRVPVAVVATVRPSACDLAAERLASLKDRLSDTGAELQVTREALTQASRDAIRGLALGDDAAEEAARLRQVTLTNEVTMLEQRLHDLKNAFPLAQAALDKAQQARAKREAAHWNRVSRTPGLTPGEQWCALTMAGARPHWDREGTKQHQPRSEERVAISVSLKEQFPFTDEE